MLSCTRIVCGLPIPLILFLLLLTSLNVRAQGYPPDEAPKHMTVQPDLEVQLVACEPMITQPVCIEFDDRKRVGPIIKIKNSFFRFDSPVMPGSAPF